MVERKKILIVDDDISVLDILVEYLKDYDVYDTTNGFDADIVLKKHSIDIILLDIMMEELDGFEVCKLLKEQPCTKDIPVIFITGKTDEQSIKKAYGFGGVDYVTKPIKKEELLSRIKTHLALNDQKNILEELVQKQQKIIKQQSKLDIIKDTLSVVKKEIQSSLEKFEDISQKELILNSIDKLSNEISFDNDKIHLCENYFYDTDKKVLYFLNEEVELSQKELSLLDLFVKNKNEPVSVEDIINTVWRNSLEKDISKESVKSQVSKLRKKIPVNIQNVYAIGYTLKVK